MEKTLSQLTADNLSDPDYYEIAKSLVRAVIIRHFNNLTGADRDDALSEGVCKIFLLLKEGKFDPSRSSKENYLYTGVRNAITNFLYKKKREIPREEPQFYDLEEPYPEELPNKIHDSSIDKIFQRFLGRYDHLKDSTKALVNSIGFDTTPYDKNNIQEDPAVERLACLIIWER